jgi:hypothetical protein
MTQRIYENSDNIPQIRKNAVPKIMTILLWQTKVCTRLYKFSKAGGQYISNIVKKNSKFSKTQTDHRQKKNIIFNYFNHRKNNRSLKTKKKKLFL